jgi:hypothetical protein
MSERARLPFGSKIHPDEQGALIINDTALVIMPSAEMRSDHPDHNNGLFGKLARLVGADKHYAECDLAKCNIEFDGRSLNVQAGDFQKEMEVGRDGFSAAEATAFMSVYQDARRNRLKSRP